MKKLLVLIGFLTTMSSAQANPCGPLALDGSYENKKNDVFAIYQNGCESLVFIDTQLGISYSVPFDGSTVSVPQKLLTLMQKRISPLIESASYSALTGVETRSAQIGINLFLTMKVTSDVKLHFKAYAWAFVCPSCQYGKNLNFNITDLVAFDPNPETSSSMERTLVKGANIVLSIFSKFLNLNESLERI